MKMNFTRKSEGKIPSRFAVLIIFLSFFMGQFSFAGNEIGDSQTRHIEIDCSDVKVNPGGAEWCDAVRAEHAYMMADKILNETYKAFIRTLPKQDRPIWIDAQRKWILYFKANCSAISAIGRSSAAIRQWNYMECLTEEISRRTNVLLKSCQTENCK